MIPIKHLLPSLRAKKRYLAYTLFTEPSLSVSSVLPAIKTHLLHFLGESSYGATELYFLPHPESTKGIVKVGHTAVDLVRTGLSLIHELHDQPVLITTHTVSGMIHHARTRT